MRPTNLSKAATATTLALLLSISMPALADNPLDDDARSGGDAPDTAEEGMPLNLPIYEWGTVTYQLDTDDFYRFDAPAQTGLQIEGSHEEGVFLDLEGPDGEFFRIGGPTIQVLTESAGTWTIHAMTNYVPPIGVDAIESVNGRYAFSIHEIGIPAQDDAGSGRDAGGTRDTAVSVSEGTYQAETGDYDLRDGFLIDVPAGKTLVATATTDTGNDATVSLWDAHGHRLTQQRGASASARYVFDAPQSVLVRVGTASGFVEPYTLGLHLNDDDRLPDLELVSVMTETEQTIIGSSCATQGTHRTLVEVYVTNPNSVAAGRFDVELEAGNELGACTHGFTAEGIEPGSTYGFFFIIEHDPALPLTLKATIDPQDNVQESDELNNGETWVQRGLL